MTLRYLVVIEPGSRNYGAYVPDLPGCISTGKTVEKTLANIKEAMTGHLALMQQDGDLIPPPVTATISDIEPGELMTWVEVNINLPISIR